MNSVHGRFRVLNLSSRRTRFRDRRLRRPNEKPATDSWFSERKTFIEDGPRRPVTAGTLGALKGTGLGASGPDNGTLVAAGASLVLGDYGVIDSFPEDVRFSSGRPDEPALNVSNDTLTGLLTLAGDGQISVAEGGSGDNRPRHLGDGRFAQSRT